MSCLGGANRELMYVSVLRKQPGNGGRERHYHHRSAGEKKKKN
jgi:hypothetical protein